MSVTLVGGTETAPKFTRIVEDSQVPVMVIATAWWLWTGLIEAMTGCTAPP